MSKSVMLKAVGIVASILMLLATGCADPQPEAVDESAPISEIEQVSLVISGSGSVVPVFDAISVQFGTDTPGYDLDALPGSGTGGGVRGVLEGTLDVAAMARPPKDEEAEQGIQYAEVGHAGTAIFVHPSTEITELTVDQVSAIFSGEVSNWSEVGGPNLLVVLYVRDEGDSSTAALREAFYGDRAFGENATVITSADDMLTAVAGTPGGVGIGNWPTVAASGTEVHAVALDGVFPTDPAYPMQTPFGVGYLAENGAVVQPLIDWLFSEAGQTALRDLDVIISN